MTAFETPGSSGFGRWRVDPLTGEVYFDPGNPGGWPVGVSTDTARAAVRDAAGRIAFSALSVDVTRVAAWSPASLFASAENGAWYDPSDLSTMNTLSTGAGSIPGVGDPVGFLADKSGNGHHAIQFVPESRPILRQTVGGRYSLEFDGVDDFLTPGFQSWFNQHVGTSAAAFATANVDGDLLSNRAGINGKYGVFVRAGPTVNAGFIGGVGPGISAQAISAETPCVFVSWGNGTSIFASLNGGAALTGARSYVSSTGRFAIGASADNGVSVNFTGEFYGAILTDDVWSATEKSNVDVYLAEKAGVAL